MAEEKKKSESIADMARNAGSAAIGAFKQSFRDVADFPRSMVTMLTKPSARKTKRAATRGGSRSAGGR